MSSIDEATLNGFREELRKHAAPNWGKILGGLGAGAGSGAALGALGGAGLGAVRSYRAARERGESVGSSVAEGASGAIRGVSKGALIGAGVGAGAGALAGHLNSPAVNQLVHGEVPLVSSGARFGQRQLHGLTGWQPDGGISAIRGGAYDAKQRFQSAVHGGVQSEIDSARQAFQAAREGERAGITSIPGIVKSIKERGLGQTLKTDLKNQWAGAGLGTKALMVGLPAAGAVGSLLKREDAASGVGKGEEVGGQIAQAAGGMVGSMVPIIGQQLISAPIGYAGKMIGRGVDRLRGVHPNQEINS